MLYQHNALVHETPSPRLHGNVMLAEEEDTVPEFLEVG